MRANEGTPGERISRRKDHATLTESMKQVRMVDKCNYQAYILTGRMKASCRFAMALHVLAVLAYKDGDRVSSQMLAGSVNTHPVIIRRLLLALQRARLVETRKGPGLGSRLSRAPARISLADVFRAVDGEERFILPARKPNAACPIGHHIRPAIQHVFVAARTALEHDLSTRSLADLVAELRG